MAGNVDVAERAKAGLSAQLFCPWVSRSSSPYINHFIQPDTIIPDGANPQSWNRYSYVLNNPLKYTDPTGHTYSCGGPCGTSGNIEDVFEAFKNSPFNYYYAQLAAAERSIYEYYVHPTDRNFDVMEADKATARAYKGSALYLVPSNKHTDAMDVFPDILGGGYVEGETDLGSGIGPSGSVVDPGATPSLPNAQPQTSTLTKTPKKTPTPTTSPTPTIMPTRTNRPTLIPRRYSGELID